MNSKTAKGIMIAVAVSLILGIIIYTIVLFVCYSDNSWIFAPYEPTVPSNACQPLIAVLPLSDEEIARQQELLTTDNP